MCSCAWEEYCTLRPDSLVDSLRERDRTFQETSTCTDRAEAFQKYLSWRGGESSSFEQMLSTMQTQSNLIGLPLGARRGCMRRQVAGCGNQHMRRLRRATQQLIFAESCLDRLDAVEIPILPQQRLAQLRQQVPLISSFAEISCHQLCRLVHLLLCIQLR